MKNFEPITKTCGKDVYQIYIGECSVAFYRKSDKARWGRKLEWNFYCRGDKQECIDNFLKKQLENQIIKENRKKERLEQQRQMKKKAIDELNIWDLLHWSRWYDMTHNDFLQVCDKKWGKVFCRFIGSKVVDGDAWYYWEEEPIKDDFCDEGKWYVISPYGWIRLSECRRAWKSEWDRSYSFNYMD